MREATNTNLIVFNLTKPRIKSTIYHTQGEHITITLQKWFNSLIYYEKKRKFKH
jgi:hypothetical protein